MAILKKFDFTGKEIEEITVSDDLLQHDAHGQMIKDYIVAYRKNQRQWSANTKRKREVNCTNAKPHPQKGMGRARQGDLASPQFVGGGRSFGPKPKFDQHVRMNKKERQAIVRYLLSEKIKQNHIFVLKTPDEEILKTKQMASFLKNLSLEKNRVLVCGENPEKEGVADKYKGIIRIMNNIPKKEFAYLPNVNGYNLMLCQDLIIMDTALEEILAVLGKGSE